MKLEMRSSGEKSLKTEPSLEKDPMIDKPLLS